MSFLIRSIIVPFSLFTNLLVQFFTSQYKRICQRGGHLSIGLQYNLQFRNLKTVVSCMKINGVKSKKSILNKARLLKSFVCSFHSCIEEYSNVYWRKLKHNGDFVNAFLCTNWTFLIIKKLSRLCNNYYIQIKMCRNNTSINNLALGMIRAVLSKIWKKKSYRRKML